MHCEQCGKENRSGSKFCRYCGAPLSASSGAEKVSRKVNWGKLVSVILIALILIAALSFGGYKAYAYYQVRSTIHNAQKLQTGGDFSDSLSALNDVGYSPTAGQQNVINTIKADDQKFLTFKASFDAAVALENASSTATASVSDNLQSALTDLQSIGTNYPGYTNVQSEITMVQNALVTALQNQASASQQAATNAEAQANAAAAAKAKAERDAEEAQSEASSAEADAQAQASQAQTTAVLTSFCNQIETLKGNYVTGNTQYNEGLADQNDDDDSVAIVYYAEANTSYSAVDSAATALNTTFTNIPDDYSTAATDLAAAAADSTQAVDTILDEIENGTDESSTINYYADLSNQYMAPVTSFISSDCQ